MTSLIKIPVASTTGMDPGDLLTNQSQAGQARIAVVATDDYVLAEYLSGGFAPGHTVTPDGGATTTTVDAMPSYCGLQVLGEFAADGTAAAPITLRGVASDGATPQRAYLDGMSVCDCLTIDALSYWRFDHLQLHRAGAYGLNGIGGECGDGCVFTHVTADLAGVHAFNNMNLLRHTLMIDCAGVDATLEGMHYSPIGGALLGCRLTGNGSYGIFHAADLTCYACVLAGNGGPGIDLEGGAFVGVFHGVLDGNPVGAYAASATSMLALIANRLTNNDDYGAWATGAAVWSDYNVYYGNGAAPSLNITHGENDHGPAGSGLPHEDVDDDGYVNRAGGDYRLADDAVGRRLALPVGSLTARLAAGLTPDDPPGHDHEVSFHEHEVTFP